MARLVLTYSDLYQRVSDFLSWGTSPTGDTLTKVKDIVARGYRQFLYPVDMRTNMAHQWNFLQAYYSLQLSSTKYKYAVPHNFSDIISMPIFSADSGYAPPMKTSGEQILNMRSNFDLSGAPEYFAIVPSTFDNEIGTAYEMWFYPTPDASYNISYFYLMDPLKPSSDSDFVVGGIRACEAILESCLAIAEQQEDDTIGIHTQLAESLIQKLIIADTMTNSDYFGNLYSDRYDRIPRRSWDHVNDALIYPDS